MPSLCQRPRPWSRGLGVAAGVPWDTAKGCPMGQSDRCDAPRYFRQKSLNRAGDNSV